jgi:protein-L-isoaspartate(D-aspartate) O-methyltransferase
MTDELLWEGERRQMVAVLRRYGIGDDHLLSVMGRIPRHLFLPKSFMDHGRAYGDHPYPIGEDQTISQPYIVAYMTEKLAIKPNDKVLEIGTGSGYQSAILAEIGACVYSIEIIPSLAAHARDVLSRLGYSDRVHVRLGNGYKGWPEEAPFNAVIATCAPTDVPEALVAQLSDRGVMIVPTGEWMDQRLVIIKKKNGCVEMSDDLPVRFVPMVRVRS